jgi:hypothetical protein
MANPPPVTDAEKQRIRELHGKGLARNEIARQLGRGQKTISKYAAEMGLDFERRERTAKAVEARVADARVARAELAVRLIEDAEKLRQRMHQPYRVWRITNDGELRTGVLNLPDARDQRDLAVALNTAVNASLRLEEFDADPGINGAKSMLGALAAGLGAAYEQLTQTEPGDGS